MQSAKEKQELNSFLQKVDDLDSIIKGLTSQDPQTQSEAISKADHEIAKQSSKQIGFDRTVINKNAYKDSYENIGPSFTEQHTSQDAFLAALEADSNKRAAARKERHRKANLVKDKGNEAFKAENFDEAIKLYTEATTIAKDLTPLYTNRAAAYIKQGAYQKAIDDCDFALRIDDKWIKSHVFKAKAFQAMHEYDKAKTEFQKITEIDVKKADIVKKYTIDLEKDQQQYEREKIACDSLKNEKLESVSISKLIYSIHKRLKDEEKRGIDTPEQLMYYAGGFRVLQAHLVDEQSRTLFRTESGFQFFTGSGSVAECLRFQKKRTNILPTHSNDLVSAAISLCTCACAGMEENLKALLSEGDMTEVFLSFLEWPDEQVKRNAITFFHDASLYAESRSVLYMHMNCNRLFELLFKPKTKKADANSAAAATLHNFSLDKQFHSLLLSTFVEKVPCYIVDCISELGHASYEALTLRMHCINNLTNDEKICQIIAKNEAFLEVCVNALERCVAAFKSGLSNPCSMAELLHLLKNAFKIQRHEVFCKQCVISLHTVFPKAKDNNLLSSILSLLCSVLDEQSCLEAFLNESNLPVIKQLFSCLKQADISLRTHALKILCFVGQGDPNYLQPLIKLDPNFALLKGILMNGDSAADKINQGHVALLLGSLSALTGGLDPILNANAEGEIMRKLLVLCRDSSTKQACANCAIALGKLAHYSNRFLVELRKHDGINILARLKTDDILG